MFSVFAPTVFLSLPLSEMTPWCLPPHPFILIFMPLVFLCLSSSHSPPASTISFFLRLFSRTFHQDTSDCWENSGAPPVCFVVQLPGFSSQSHYWLLLNTRKQRCNQGELHRVLVLLYFFIPLWFPASCKIWRLWGENASNVDPFLSFLSTCSLSAMQTSLFQWRLMGLFIRYCWSAMEHHSSVVLG